MGILEGIGIIALVVVLGVFFPRISFVVVFVLVLKYAYNFPLFSNVNDFSGLVSILMSLSALGAFFLDILTIRSIRLFIDS